MHPTQEARITGKDSMTKVSESLRSKGTTQDHLPPASQIDDFSDAIIEIQLAFLQLSRLTGEQWNWNHPRMRRYLSRCGAKNRYWLPLGRYEFLVKELWKLIEELENAAKNR